MDMNSVLCGRLARAPRIWISKVIGIGPRPVTDCIRRKSCVIQIGKSEFKSPYRAAPTPTSIKGSLISTFPKQSGPMHAKYCRRSTGSSRFLPSALMPPRSAADILASARPAPPKRSRKPAKVNSLGSDAFHTIFCNWQLQPQHSHPFLNISTETGTSGPYVPLSTFKVIPTSTPDTFLTTRGEEDGRITDMLFWGIWLHARPSNIQCYISNEFYLYCSLSQFWIW